MPVSSPQLAHGQDPARRPDHLREREQARPRRDGGADRIGLGRDDDDPRARDVASAPSRPKCSSVVVTISSLRAEPEAAEDDVAAVGRARRERDLQRLGADECRERVPQLLPQLHHAREVRPAAAAVAVVPLELRAASPRSVARAIGPKVPALR